jgi:hypothetical protein
MGVEHLTSFSSFFTFLKDSSGSTCSSDVDVNFTQTSSLLEVTVWLARACVANHQGAQNVESSGSHHRCLGGASFAKTPAQVSRSSRRLNW